MPEMSKAGIDLFWKRYSAGGKESVGGMFDRVSMGNPDYRCLMEELQFFPNSPALFNLGTGNGCTASACFVFDIDDEMGPLPTDNHRSIVNTRAKAVAVAKAGGGVGYYGGNLRPRNSLIKSVHRKACGPVAVLKDLHGVSTLITQGGKRELAQMFILPVWHDDIEEFITCKDADPHSLSSFNISVGWPDEQRSKVDFEVVGRLLTMASYNGAFPESRPNWAERWSWLWAMQVFSAWTTGCPGMWFPDEVNRKNPNKHLGLINAPNPCGETPNRSDEPCSLGSIAICRFLDLRTRRFRKDEYLAKCRTAFRFMDDILDRNIFPHPEITKAALLTRKLGFGIMGWADFLALQGIRYGTEEAVELGRSIWAETNEVLLEESIQLAKEKGPYPGYDPERTNGPWCRNESRSSVAPTGSIAILADVWGSIEPFFAYDATRQTGDGMTLESGIPGWTAAALDGFVPDLAGDIDYKWHVEMQAAFQESTCLGVSKTINLPNGASPMEVSSAYRMMADLRCKGGTIFRNGCRSDQVIRAKPVNKYDVVPAVVASGEAADTGWRDEAPASSQEYMGPKLPEHPARRMVLPATRRSVTHKFKIASVAGFLTVGLYEDGKPGEVFLRYSKAGSALSGLLDQWAMSVSLALQYGTPLASLVRLHRGTCFEPNGLTDCREVPVCTSITDYVARWLDVTFLGTPPASGPAAELARMALDKEGKEDPKEEQTYASGSYCPECGATAVRQAGCLMCLAPGCYWSKCG